MKFATENYDGYYKKGSRLKKQTIILVFFVFSLTLFAQEIQHEAVAVNIEVPVRVYDKDNFVGDLAIDDFELYENGILQTIDAVYLINKTSTKREDSRINT